MQFYEETKTKGELCYLNIPRTIARIYQNCSTSAFHPANKPSSTLAHGHADKLQEPIDARQAAAGVAGAVLVAVVGVVLVRLALVGDAVDLEADAAAAADGGLGPVVEADQVGVLAADLEPLGKVVAEAADGRAVVRLRLAVLARRACGKGNNLLPVHLGRLVRAAHAHVAGLGGREEGQEDDLGVLHFEE